MDEHQLVVFQKSKLYTACPTVVYKGSGGYPN